MYIYLPILQISVSETQMVSGVLLLKKKKEKEKKKTKVRETFLFELLYRRDRIYYIADPHFDAVLDWWEVFNEKGLRYI